MSFRRSASATEGPELPTGWSYLDPFQGHLEQLWEVPGFVVALEEASRALREETLRDSRGRLRDLPIGTETATQTLLPSRCTVATQTSVSGLRTGDVATQTDPKEDLIQYGPDGVPIFDDRGYGKAGPILPIGEDFRRRQDFLPKAPSVETLWEQYDYRTNEEAGTKAAARSFPRPPTRLCYNCGEDGHQYSECREPRKRFCYRCGAPNKTIKECPNCYEQWRSEGPYRRS
ncbi:hypothetical protein KPH14_012585 [Odynerus spinipes]|uniref:CCHC-type domain-containing protein n=1 Tax=Odynerus spinipes TaxID=1348599 RepID=A0AAD9RER9_9HYME|nr:hypothetical protein KPH14_012585 [Odynerus spinipes]